ncbi:MAG: low molecular weight protein arginine phosphatase [Chloroflexi bacterium]|nr:MAG: low molecular weight protein arginine phosphatase [Chloroflexota bacterium]
MSSILFVCTANQCRSPLAEVIGRQLLTTRYPGIAWQVGSAGVRAVNGYPATPASVTVAGRHGFDLSRHNSRALTEPVVEAADLLVTMEAAHKRAILAAFVQAEGRVFALGELIGESADVDDPIGLPLEQYEYTYALLEKWINEALPHIARLTGAA